MIIMEITKEKAIKNAIKGAGYTLDSAALKMKMPRTTFYNHLSKEVTDPEFVQLVRTFLKIDLQPVIDGYTTKRPTGEDLRNKKAFAPTIDSGLIHVPIAAQAGYAQHYEDPLFIQDLDRIYLPSIKFKGDDFRSFEVEGDSMEPTLKEGVQVIAQKVYEEDWQQLWYNYIHVIVTRSQILIKRPIKVDEETIALASDNEELYPQFLVDLKDIKEIWRVRRKIDYDMAPPRIIELKVKK